jgi:hypothetical protein
VYQISGGKEIGNINTESKESLEIFHNNSDEARKYRQVWNDRLSFPLSFLQERYIHGRATVLFDGILRDGEQLGRFSFLVVHDSFRCFRTVLPMDAHKDNCEFPMFVESVHVVYDEKRVVERLGGIVWLQALDSRENLRVVNSLYFSLVSGNFRFVGWPTVKHGKLDTIGGTGSIGVTGELPNQMVKAGTQVVDGFSGKDTEPQWKGTLEVELNRFLNKFSIFIGDDWVKAFIEKPYDFKIEISDILVGPFDLLVDSL